MDKKIAFLVIFTVIVIIGGAIGIFFVVNGGEEKGVPKIEIPEPEFDAGQIQISGGDLRHVFKIRNVGTGVLEINSIGTSCMCTKATLKTNEGTSPEFGMHGTDLLWSGKISPGEEADLEVVFDPAFHGDEATGPVVRNIDLSTNDKERKKVELKLSADVTK